MAIPAFAPEERDEGAEEEVVEGRGEEEAEEEGVNDGVGVGVGRLNTFVERERVVPGRGFSVQADLRADKTIRLGVSKSSI